MVFDGIIYNVKLGLVYPLYDELRIKLFITVIKMKWEFILGALCMLLLISPAVVFANEDTYIVTLNDTVSFYGLTKNDERNYIVVSSEELTEYLDEGIVAEYEPNYKVELLGENWNLDAVNCDFAWELGCFGNEVRIGVIDSGIYPFPELEDNIIEGKNYLDGSSDTADNIGHGTFVTGIIASKSKGISYESKIIPLKCFDKNKDTYVNDLLDAIYDAIDIYDCDVINMSLGLTADSTRLKRAITYATNHGAIVVSAVGNDGNTAMYYPAGYDNAIGVGSVDKALEKSWFSQNNKSVFVTAPGEELESLSVPGYTENAGTSFSTPHVTALAAVAKCIDKEITTEEFMNLLSVTSKDLGDTGYDNAFGYGLVDFESLISKMLENTEVFISPMYEENGKIFGVIYNNFDDKKDVTLINANYNGNQFLKVNSEDVSLEAKQKYTFKNDACGNVVKYMVWKNIKSLIPLAEIRIYNKNGG